MKAFFTSIGNLVGLISAGTTTQLAIDSTQADIIKGLGFGESLVMLILTALLAIIIIICVSAIVLFNLIIHPNLDRFLVFI